MKNFLLILITVLGFQTISYAQNDEIIGIWLNEKKDSKIKVYKRGNSYYGKVIWLKNDKNDDGTSPKVDSKNPNAKLHTRTIVGTNILKDLKWDASDKEWNSGEIYDPRGGSTYSVFAKLQDKNTLYLKGYIGFSLIGRSTLWTRAE